MGTPTTLQNVDERGYVFVTEAADCQIVTRQKTVDDSTNPTPTPIPQDASDHPSNLPARRRIYIKNWHLTGEGDTVYIGGADVSAGNGYPISSGDELILDVTDDIQLYAIVESEKIVDLRTLELA